MNSPSTYALIKHNKIPISTGYRKLKEASTKRKIIFDENGEGITKWSTVKKRKKYCKISSELRTAVVKWLLDHPHIIPSPIYNDTLFLKDASNNNSKIRISKYLRQVSIRELHNNLLSDPPKGISEVYDDSGKPIISDTAFRTLLPSYIKPMRENYKQMCGCEICILVKSLQNDLNLYRLAPLNRLEKSRIDNRKAKEYQ